MRPETMARNTIQAACPDVDAVDPEQEIQDRPKRRKEQTEAHPRDGAIGIIPAQQGMTSGPKTDGGDQNPAD